MSDFGNNDRDEEQEDGKQARQAYHAAAAERAPAPLDERVLGLARREAGKDRWPGLLPWLRPAAFVATVGLCLAVVLEFSDLATIEGDPAATGLPTDAPAAVVDDFFSAAQDSTDRIRSIGDNAAERDLQGDRLPNDVLPGGGEPTFCNAEQTASPQDWQRCILALEQAGRDAAADIEAQRLRDTFPDYSPQE